MLLMLLLLTVRTTYAAGDCPDNYYWNGTQCSACSGCPVGFGLREPCSKTKNTECQECYPGYDYSNSTGMEECIKCDTYSNCLPGRSKKITNCTIYSGHTCDGCEEGYYHHRGVGCDKCSPKCDAMTEDEIQACTTRHDRRCVPKRELPKTPPVFSNGNKVGCEEGYYYRQDVGCEKCSPKCNATTEDEIQACTTNHNRHCAPKRELSKTPPVFSNDSKVRGNSSRTANEEKSKIPQIDPGSVESKTAWPREENSIVTNLWFWFPLTVIALLLVTVPIRRYKRRSRVNRPPQPEGDVDTDNTEENIVLREQKTPLISEGGLDAHDTRETVSSAEPRVPLRLRHELEINSGRVDLEAPKPSSEEVSRQGLDRPIKDLAIKEKKQIKNDLSGKDIEGYFYWQSVAEELGFKDESRGWEGAQNPIENLLKAFGEKEGSTIRGLIEATRRAGLTHCASQWERKFDTTPRKDTTDSAHTALLLNEMNDNSTSVDIPPDPGKGNGATESVYKTPGKGEINDKADSVINIPENTVEETDANYIADTAV
nr:tumor necrosis factor receptor superfamily member 16-like isoform X2 [Pocillopora verrucosa]